MKRLEWDRVLGLIGRQTRRNCRVCGLHPCGCRWELVPFSFLPLVPITQSPFEKDANRVRQGPLKRLRMWFTRALSRARHV